MGRVFESPSGKGVYLSVLLRPAVPAASAQTATIGAAVAVCRAVQELCGLELGIKWVNDLYYQGKKVCGILTEAGTDLESGRLVVQRENGRPQALRCGEVTTRPARTE